jgi:hypothetical protein
VIIDILTELFYKRITLYEANAVYEKLMDSKDAGKIVFLLNLTLEEWSAFCQGADFDVISKWRHMGWPEKCAICNKTIEEKNHDWFVFFTGNKVTLRHVVCFPLSSPTLDSSSSGQ